MNILEIMNLLIIMKHLNKINKSILQKAFIKDKCFFVS